MAGGAAGEVSGAGRRGQAHQLPSETAFPEKAAGVHERDDGFFAPLRNHGQLDPACLDIEHGVRHIPLRKENLLFPAGQQRFASPDL